MKWITYIYAQITASDSLYLRFKNPFLIAFKMYELILRGQARNDHAVFLGM